MRKCHEDVDVVALLDQWDTQKSDAIDTLKKWDTTVQYEPIKAPKRYKPNAKVIAASVAVAIAGFTLSPATLTLAASNDSMIEIKKPTVNLKRLYHK
jgi:hypothetical protein